MAPRWQPWCRSPTSRQGLSSPSALASWRSLEPSRMSRSTPSRSPTPSVAAARSAHGPPRSSDTALAMIVLDTDIVSDLMRPQPSPHLLERLAGKAASEEATTAITIGELAYGARRVDRPDLYERAMRLLSDVPVLPFDRDAAERYGSIRSELERAGRRLPDPDLRIAATTLVG